MELNAGLIYLDRNRPQSIWPLKTRHSPATRPINPSSASTSRTKVPFPTPPIDGLQDSSPIVSIFCVNKRVLAPVRAAPAAASQPA